MQGTTTLSFILNFSSLTYYSSATRTAVIFVIIHVFLKWKVSVCRLLVPINDRYKAVAWFDLLGCCDVL